MLWLPLLLRTCLGCWAGGSSARSAWLQGGMHAGRRGPWRWVPGSLCAGRGFRTQKWWAVALISALGPPASAGGRVGAWWGAGVGAAPGAELRATRSPQASMMVAGEHRLTSTHRRTEDAGRGLLHRVSRLGHTVGFPLAHSFGPPGPVCKTGTARCLPWLEDETWGRR